MSRATERNTAISRCGLLEFIFFARDVPPDHWDLWRIRPTGSDLAQLTFHNSMVSHPVLLDVHTLPYLATDAQGRRGCMAWFSGVASRIASASGSSVYLTRRERGRCTARGDSGSSELWTLAPTALDRHDRDGRDTIVALRSDFAHKDFWLIDLKTGSERRLTQLTSDFDIRDFRSLDRQERDPVRSRGGDLDRGAD